VAKKREFSQRMVDRKTVEMVLPICAEVLRRRAHPLYTYAPDDHAERNQLGFHQSTAMIRLVFGGNQSGKTRCVAQEVAMLLLGKHRFRAVRTPIRVYAISASYRTLQEGLYRHLKYLLPEWEVAAKGPLISGGWELPNYVRLRNGSQIDFISGEGREEARKKIQAAEIDVAVIDEEVDQLIWDELQVRRLARGGSVIVCATLVRSEPWCLALEDRSEAGDSEVHVTRLSTLKARDRGHVSARIVAEMESMLCDEDRAVRLLGKSRRNEGLVYPEFGRANIIEPFVIPKTWTRYCAMDPGWRTFAVLWVAVAPNGNYVIYREIYAHATHYQVISDTYFAASGYKKHPTKPHTWMWDDSRSEKFQVVWVDPSAFGHHETGEMRTGNLLAREGVPVCPARNDVMAGIELCRGSLMEGMDGVPRMRIFNTCRETVLELRQYRIQKDNKDANRHEKAGTPIKRKDHACDCWRYLEMGGLQYVPPADPRWCRTRDIENPLPIPVSQSMEQSYKEHWQKIMLDQRGAAYAPAHPGGIGGVY
jgi:hypothetical protein